MEFIKKIKSWHAILGVFVTITSLYSGAAAIGLSIPRFVWISELNAAEKKINDVQIRMERLQQDSLRRVWSDTVSRIAELEAKNIPVPTSLKSMEEMLRNDLQEQTRYLKELENNQ